MTTIETIMALRPCYKPEQIASLMLLDPYEALCSVPSVDARWLLTRLMTADQRDEWAHACARRAREYAIGRAAAEAAARSAEAAALSAWALSAWAARDAAKSAAAGATRAPESARAAEHHIAIRHALLLLGVTHSG